MLTPHRLLPRCRLDLSPNTVSGAPRAVPCITGCGNPHRRNANGRGSLTLSPGWIRGTRSYLGSERWRTATWERAIHGNRVHEPVIRAPTAQLRTSLRHRPSHCSLTARVNPRRSGQALSLGLVQSRGVSPPHPTAMAANPLQSDRRLNPFVSWTVGAWHDSGLRSGDRQ